MNGLDKVMELVIERLNTIESKLDKQDEKIDKQAETLTRNTENLSYHIKRTDLAEKNMDLLRDEIKPIKRHVILIESVFKIIGALAVVTSLAYNVIKLLN